MFACQDEYLPTEDVYIVDVIEASGLNADCNISLYQELTFINNNAMNQSGSAYSYNYSILAEGVYHAEIECNKSGAIYTSQCAFEVGGGDTMNYIAIAIAIVGFLFLLFKISDNIQFYYKDLNISKHIIGLVAMWLLLPLINIAIKASEEQGYLITDTLVAVYSAAMYIMIFLTSMYVIGIFVYSLYKLAGDKN